MYSRWEKEIQNWPEENSARGKSYGKPANPPGPKRPKKGGSTTDATMHMVAEGSDPAHDDLWVRNAEDLVRHHLKLRQRASSMSDLARDAEQQMGREKLSKEFREMLNMVFEEVDMVESQVGRMQELLERHANGLKAGTAAQAQKVYPVRKEVGRADAAVGTGDGPASSSKKRRIRDKESKKRKQEAAAQRKPQEVSDVSE